MTLISVESLSSLGLQKTEPTFDIRIKASSDEDFYVVLGFVMNATYPKTPPILTLKKWDGFRDATLFKITKFLETQPKVFARRGQGEMCDSIVEGVREILEDAALAKAHGRTLPSLEEERERHEATLAKLAQEQQEAEKRKKEEESKEEERVMAAMVESELERQRKSAKESKGGRAAAGSLPMRLSRNSVADSETLDFDQLCTTKDKTGNILSFRSVTGKCDPRRGPVAIVYVVRPVLSNGQGNYTMALKESVFRSNPKDLKDFKKQLQNVESKLQDLKNTRGLQHRHIVEILDFKVESDSGPGASATNSWKVSLLTPLAEKGPLEELLELAGQLDIGKVRSWTRDLLDALSFLHNKNIAHQDIHPGNILLFRDPDGEIIPKISDMSYQREFHNITAQKRALPGITSAKSAYWLPPEIAGASRPQYTFKTDIWDFGIVFVQMIFGLDVLKKYSSPKNLMESLLLSLPLHELVSRFFKDDKNKRPRAFELGSSEFLATDAPVFQDDAQGGGLSATPSLNNLQTLPSKLRRDSMTRSVITSRYTEDFTEEGRLGKGGFGEVVKARKKLDGQIYAIKKITQRSQASLTEILKEVRLLSQLSHPAVVRYYNTWVEEVADVSGTDGESSTDFTSETRDTDAPSVDIQFHTSTGGLDFMSSNAIVEFGYSDDEDDDEDVEDDDLTSEDEDEDDETDERTGSPVKERNMAFNRRARSQRPYRTILYISMEYCEKRVSSPRSLRMIYVCSCFLDSSGSHQPRAI
jgi:eukaryotic translation initiation factor 2-alpha kinase 4